MTALQGRRAMSRDAQVARPEVGQGVNDPSENVRELARQAVRQITEDD